MVFAASGTRSGFNRRPAALRASAFSVTSPDKLFAPIAKTLSGLSENAAIDLGGLTHARRFAQCAPTHRETTQRSDIMNTNSIQQQLPVNTLLHRDCIQAMRQMPANSVDFILTDPPYLVNYRDRNGRTIQNDVKEDWLRPTMTEAYRVLKQDRVAVMFYGWTKVDAFFAVWKDAGFQPVGHLVFRKACFCSKTRWGVS
jgi:16S rRNA G966 N2-methylase RsmD